MEHQRGKRFFKVVRKGKHIYGIGQRVRRQRLIHRLKERNLQRRQKSSSDQTDDLPTVPFEEHEPLPPLPPTEHHQISTDTRQRIQITQWLDKNSADPAVFVSIKSYYSFVKIH
jgi:hypothetical protein